MNRYYFLKFNLKPSNFLSINVLIKLRQSLDIKISLILAIISDNDDSLQNRISAVLCCMEDYENIIRTKKKGIISIAYHQGKMLKKFKDKRKFIRLVNAFKVHKTTIIFKINIYKLCERQPKLLKSSIGLVFLKNYYKDVKEIYSQNGQEFS